MNPELVALAKKLHRRNHKTGERKSLRLIAAELPGTATETSTAAHLRRSQSRQ
jgi:hypothetical protein